MDNCPMRRSLNVDLDVHPAPDGYWSLYEFLQKLFLWPYFHEEETVDSTARGPHKEYLGVKTQRVLCCGFSIVLSSRYTREGRLPSNTPGLERPSPPWHPDTAIKSQVAPQPGGSQLWHLEGFKRTTRGKVGYCKTSPPAVTCLPPHLYLYLAANVLKPTIIFYSERLWSGQCKS